MGERGDTEVGVAACVCVCVRTSSVMVAENNMVCLLKEHILMISFICSSKYSSSILSHTRTQVRNQGAGPHSLRRQGHSPWGAGLS